MRRFSPPQKRLLRHGGNSVKTRCYYTRTYDREDGTRSWLTTGCTTKRAAEEWINARQLEEVAGEKRAKAQRARRLTFKDAVEKWLEDKRGAVGESYRKSLRYVADAHWIPALGKKRLQKVTSDDITKFLRRRRASGRSATSVNNDRRWISSLYCWAIKKGLATENPARDAERHSGEIKRRVRHISREEEARLLSACRNPGKIAVKGRRNKGGRKGGKLSRQATTWEQESRVPDWLYYVTLLAVRSGFRRRTILELQWKDIDFSRGRWRISGKKMKSGRDYEQPIARSVLGALEQYRKKITEAEVKAGRNPMDRVGPSARVFGLSDKTTLRRPLTAACKRAGLRLSFHDLRGVFLNRCAEAGVDIKVAMELSDHTSLAVVMRHYASVRTGQAEAAIGAVDGEIEVKTGVIEA